MAAPESLLAWGSDFQSLPVVIIPAVETFRRASRRIPETQARNSSSVGPQPYGARQTPHLKLAGPDARYGGNRSTMGLSTRSRATTGHLLSGRDPNNRSRLLARHFGAPEQHASSATMYCAESGVERLLFLPETHSTGVPAKMSRRRTDLVVRVKWRGDGESSGNCSTIAAAASS